MTKQKPLILITNDDGYFAGGIQFLAECAKEIGDVVVVTPDGPRSGMSSALTSIEPLRYFLMAEKDNVKTYVCTGTPVDCVKIGMNEVLDRKPDLVLTGINHGANTAIAVLYSGTMGAAMEACLFDVPAIGFSLLNHSLKADFSHCKDVIISLSKKVLAEGLPSGTCLNVNLPDVDKIKGIKVCRQAKGKWVEEVIPGKDGFDNPIFWLGGYFKNYEEEAKDTDDAIVGKGYASVVPVKVDMTDYEFLKKIKSWEDNI